MSGGGGECCDRWMERKVNVVAGEREGMQVKGGEKVYERRVKSVRVCGRILSREIRVRCEMKANGEERVYGREENCRR